MNCDQISHLENNNEINFNIIFKYIQNYGGKQELEIFFWNIKEIKIPR